MASSDFVTQFHNLEGDLISERKKNFFKLLKSQPRSLKEDDLESLCPRTYLESLFQIDIFIYFKMSAKLLDVIKRGNEVFISKILKHPSLLMDVIGSISAENFVNEFLPCTSYVIRMKILKRISLILKEHQMDEIVSAVHKRYGLPIASKILHTCSSKKIKEYLSNSEIILKSRQLKFIFDKDPEIFLAYLEHHKKSTGKQYNHKELCRYIALKNPEMLLKLQKERTISCKRLGRRISKILIDHSGNDFLNNIEFYSEFLKLDAVVRKLHGNFKEVYFQLFPRNIHDVRMYNFCNTLLKWYPKSKQWDLFTQTFMRVFDKNILDNLNCLDLDFIPLFPNKIILNDLGEQMYSKSKSNYDLKWCNPNKVIPLIKEKINATSSIYERNMLVELLLENCQVNEDLTALEAVLEYICLRHLDQNLYRILDKIKDCFKMEKFNEKHWKHISEMISVVRSGEKFNYYIIIMFTSKHIEFLVIHEKSFRKELLTYLEEFYLNVGDLLMRIKHSKVEKQILLEVIEVYPDRMEYINIIINFNERYPEDTIDISKFPIVCTHIKSLLNQTSTLANENGEINMLSNVINYNFTFPEKPIIVIEESKILELFRHSKDHFQCDKAVEKIVKTSNRTEFENEVLQFFWGNLLERYNLRRRIVRWLFTNEPKTISPHLDRLWSLDQSCIEIKYIKLMSHLDFDKKALDYFTSELKCIDDLLQKINRNKAPGGIDMEVDNKPEIKIQIYTVQTTIKSLCSLLTTSEFIENVAKRFLPFKDKIDPADTMLNDIYFLQCALAGFLKKLDEPAIVLPTVMKFCLGDYLQSALQSLYSICYRTPEMLLYSYMDSLSNRAVSARKHSLFLSCELLNYNYTLNKFQNFKEKNVSSQKHMFSAMLKYFRKNGSQELLDIIALNLNKINKHDVETLQDLVDFDVPTIHKGVFIQKCWYAFENLRRNEVEVQYYLQYFLEFIIRSDGSLEWLPIDFCKHIIVQYFKASPETDYDLNDIHRFICLILRNLKSEQTYYFKFVFEIIASFKTNNCKETIKAFFNSFYDIATQDIKINSKIDGANNCHIELFKQYWFDTFTPARMFDEYVLLNLLYLRCKASDTDNFVENYAKELVIFLEKLVEEYGPYIYSKFKDLMLQKHSLTEKEKCVLFYNILKFKNSTVNCLLVLDLLKCHCCNDDIKNIHCQIIDIMKNSDEPIVLINFDSSFE